MECFLETTILGKRGHELLPKNVHDYGRLAYANPKGFSVAMR